MTDPGYRHIVLLIDRSGSMRSKKEDTEGGVAEFLAAQAAAGVRTSVTLCQFDHAYEVVYEMAEIGRVPAFELVPRGSTALLDAIGRSIAAAGEQLAALPEQERPGSVVMVVATDGHENVSSEYSLEDVKQMITHQQDVYGWTFVFLGADQDAFTAGTAMGIPREQTLSYAGTATRRAFAAVSDATTRSGLGQAYAFTDAERAGAAGEAA